MSTPITLGNIIGVAKNGLLVRVIPLKREIHLNTFANTLHLEDIGDQIARTLDPPSRVVRAESSSSTNRTLDDASVDPDWRGEGPWANLAGSGSLCWRDYSTWLGLGRLE